MSNYISDLEYLYEHGDGSVKKLSELYPLAPQSDLDLYEESYYTIRGKLLFIARRSFLFKEFNVYGSDSGFKFNRNIFFKKAEFSPTYKTPLLFINGEFVNGCPDHVKELVISELKKIEKESYIARDQERLRMGNDNNKFLMERSKVINSIFKKEEAQ